MCQIVAARIRAKRRPNISIPLSPKSQAETGSIDKGCMTERYSLLYRFYYPAGPIIPLLVDYELYTHVPRSSIRSYSTSRKLRMVEFRFLNFQSRKSIGSILINTFFKSRSNCVKMRKRNILLYIRKSIITSNTKKAIYLYSIIRSILVRYTFDPFASFIF